MMTIDSIRTRAARLQTLNLGLAEEVARWKGAESPLLDAERQAYLKEIQSGIAGFDAALHALTSALARIVKEAAARRGSVGVERGRGQGRLEPPIGGMTNASLSE
jgi:hypothetical protein